MRWVLSGCDPKLNDLEKGVLSRAPFFFEPMKRLIITGANGSGKSHLAARCCEARPDVSVTSFDAIKLMTDWEQRSRFEIDADLYQVVVQESWIIEGGPSLLKIALPHADAVVWLDPPFLVRATNLLCRPWKHRGQTRPELPDGNQDFVRQQYRFAWRSLRKERDFRRLIVSTLSDAPCPVIGVTSRVDADGVVSLWSGQSGIAKTL